MKPFVKILSTAVIVFSMTAVLHATNDSIKPLGKDVIKAAAQKTGNTVITVEDHYAEGGLGDAVAGELSVDGIKVHKLAVRELPHSGKPDELIAKYGIDSNAIIKAVKSL